MAWIIRVVICPRCGHEVRADALRPAAVEWFDSDAAGDGLWRSGRPGPGPRCASAPRVTRPCYSCTTSTCIGCARSASTRRVADAPTTTAAGTGAKAPRCRRSCRPCPRRGAPGGPCGAFLSARLSSYRRLCGDAHFRVFPGPAWGGHAWCEQAVGGYSMATHNSLFSTYRQGENRVTSSMIAVFERIGLGLVERLLGAAAGESALELVTFRNQVGRTPGSVPDAEMSANFRFLFGMVHFRRLMC